MALKDWSKVGTLRWRKNGMIVDVSMSKSGHHYITKSAGVMSVKHERSNTYFEDKVFPTKIQAVSSAKKYMRKH